MHRREVDDSDRPSMSTFPMRSRTMRNGPSACRRPAATCMSGQRRFPWREHPLWVGESYAQQGIFGYGKVSAPIWDGS
jgi:hypothetical protein